MSDFSDLTHRQKYASNLPVRYGFFLCVSDGLSENSNQPNTINPIATPVMAIQVPSLSI